MKSLLVGFSEIFRSILQDIRQNHREAVHRCLFQPFIQCFIGIDLKSGEKELTEFERKVAFFGNFDRILDRLRTVGKEPDHLVGGTEIKLIGPEPHPV